MASGLVISGRRSSGFVRTFGKLASRAGPVLVGLALVLAGAPQVARAAVALGAGGWTQVQATNSGNLSGSKTADSGTNRALVVVAAAVGTVGTAPTCSGTYGGSALTQGAVSPGTSYRKTCVLTLDEAGIAAATGTTLSVTISAGTVSGAQAWAAFYTGVDQASLPPTITQGNASTNNVVAYAAPMTAPANGAVVVGAGGYTTASGATYTSTGGYAYAAQAFNNTNVAIAVWDRSVGAAGETDTVTATFTGNTNASAISAVALSPAAAAAGGAAGGSVVYSNNSTTPQARTYTTSSDAFGTASGTQAGSTPRWIVTRAAPTRNERIVAFTNSTGTLYVYRWDGTTWTNETAGGGGWGGTVATGNATARRVDVAYESTSGNAVVLYSKNTTTSGQQLGYRTWNGTTWSAEQTVGFSSLTGTANWIKLASRVTSGSNEIIAAVSDTNNDLTTFRWNGTTWTEISTTALTTGLQVVTTVGDIDAFALASESASGDTFLVYATTGPRVYYRTLTAGATSWSTATTFTNGNNVVSVFADADPDPASNRVVTGFGLRSSNSAYAAVWSGSALSTSTQVATNHNNNVTTSGHTTEGAWLNTGTARAAVVAYASTSNTTVDYAYTTNDGGGWTTNRSWTASGLGAPKNWLDFAADPKTATNAMLTFNDSNNNLWAKRVVLSGTSTFTWSNSDGGTALTTNLGTASYQPFSFAYDRFTPTVTIATGASPASSVSVGPSAPALLNDFTLQTNSGTATVSAVAVNLSSSTNVASLSIHSTSACTGDTTYGTLSAGLASGANTITLGTSISATSTATDYYLCLTSAATVTGTSTATGSVTGATASGYVSAGSSAAQGTVTIGATLTVAAGTPAASSVTVGGGATALLNDFTVQTGSGSATVTAVAVNLPSSTNVASLSVHSTSACTGDTTYGTLTGPAAGANTITLGTSFTATTTATAYYLCLTSAATVTASSTATASVTGATASGFTSAGSSAAQGTVTINPALTVAAGTAAPSVTVGPSTPALLNAFTLQTSGGTATVTAIPATLSANTNVASLSVHSTSACTGDTTYGTLTSPAAGAVTVSLTTSISATATATTYYLCLASTASVAASSSATGAVTGATATGYVTGGSSAAQGTVTIAPPTLLVAAGSTPAPSVTVGASQPALLNAFTLQANVGSATVTAVAVNVPTVTNVASVSIHSTSACTGDTTYGTKTTPTAGANTVSLTTSITATTTAGTYYLCLTSNATVSASSTVTGSVTSGTATGYPSSGSSATQGTVTISPPALLVAAAAAPAPSATIGGSQTAPLNAFTLQTNGSTATVTKIAVNLSSNANVASVSIRSSSTCSGGTTYGTLNTPASGAGTVNLTTSISATTTAGTYYLCLTSNATVSAGSSVTGSVTGGTATGYTSSGASAAQGTVTISPPTIVVAAGSPAASSVSITQGQVALLNAFTLQTNGGSATVTAVAANLSANANVASLSVQSTSACSGGTTYGTLSSPATGAITISLTTTIPATASAATYYLCLTAAASVTTGSSLTGAVTGVTASGYASTGSSAAQGTVTINGPAASLQVTLGSPAPAAANVAAGSSGTVIGRIALTPANGTVTLNALSVSNVLSGGGSGTAVAGTDVAGLDLFDVTGATTVFVGSAAWNSTTSHYDFTNLAYAISAARTFAVTLDVGPGATAARTFAMNVTVPADVTVASPSTVSNTTTLQGNTFTITAGTQGGSTASNAPMVSIVNPSSATVVSPNPGFKVQIRVFNKVGNKGVDGVSSVTLSADNGATFPYTASANTAYDAIFNDPAWATTVTGRTYEVVVSNLAQGSYTLRARAANTVPQTVLSEPVQVVVAAAGKGDGNLLVRDNSAQLCTDCHAVQTHSSEALGTTYGAWATTCRDCHTPHRTRNVALVRESITPPSVNGIQPAKNVGFVKFTGDSNTAGWDTTNGRPTVDASFVNTTDRSGPCQVCHTRTVNPANGLARWRNTGNADSHWVAPNTAACTGCHSHKVGFAPGESNGGSACASCHTPIWNAMTGVTAGLASKHQLGSVTGTNDSPTDSGVNWGAQTVLTTVTPSQRSCVNMCHGDHPHDLTSPVDSTHSYNLYLDPSNATSRADGTANRTPSVRSNTDFDPTTNTGMCAKCHAKPIVTGGITVSASAYGASKHDFTTWSSPSTSTWQYSLHKGTTARNCTKCHASRTEGTTPTSSASGSGTAAVHGTQDDSLLAGAKRASSSPFVCYNCHGSAAAVDGSQGNRSGKDVQTQFTKTQRHPVDTDTHHDTVAEAAATGFPNATLNGTNRHANCLDCHDTHAAQGTLRNYSATADANRNKIPAGSPLLGADGIRYGTNASGKTYPALPASGTWPASTSANFDASLVTSATYEYEVCFKCHTAYAFGGTSGVTTVNGPSGLAETDLGMEFSPNMRSGHPVVAPLNNYPNSPTPKALAAAQLSAPFNTNVGTQTMTCTDCHYGDAASPAVQGPHGSAVTFMLRGPNTHWPTDASGTLYALGTGNTVPTYSGLFCQNCHPLNNGTSWYNNVHLEHGNQLGSGLQCIHCHIVIPHGGMVSRLIATSNMPSRYAYQNTLSNAYLQGFTKAASPTGYNTGNCKSNNGSCGTHSGSNTTESW